MSNEIKDSSDTLEIYRSKDLVEKAFENLKDRLNLRRVALSSEQSLDGKLFVQFIALIFLSHITKKMQENKLFKDYTLQEILDEIDVIECFEVPGQRRQLGEITKRLMDLYTTRRHPPLTRYNKPGVQGYSGLGIQDIFSFRYAVLNWDG